MEKLTFLGCGTKYSVGKFGNNSAFMRVSNNDGNNVLMMDCGKRTMEVVESAGFLKDINQLIFFLSHAHPDHAGEIPLLFDKCLRNGVDIRLLLPIQKKQRNRILDCLINECGVSEMLIREAKESEVAELMDLKSVNQRVLKHVAENMKYDDPEINTTALIFERKTPYDGERCKIVFASDHNDPRFIKEVIGDKKFEHLYTDCTDLSQERCDSHIALDTLKDIVPKEMRDRVTLMHMPTLAMPHMGKAYGFNTADELLFAKKKQYFYANYSHEVLKSGAVFVEPIAVR